MTDYLQYTHKSKFTTIVVWRFFRPHVVSQASFSNGRWANSWNSAWVSGACCRCGEKHLRGECGYEQKPSMLWKHRGMTGILLYIHIYIHINIYIYNYIYIQSTYTCIMIFIQYGYRQEYCWGNWDVTSNVQILWDCAVQEICWCLKCSYWKVFLDYFGLHGHISMWPMLLYWLLCESAMLL